MIKNQVKEEKILNDFSTVLNYLDNSSIKKLFSDIALNVIIKGSYYGVICDFDDSFSIQELPVEYCRTRFFSNNVPIVELNMRFFDKYFPYIQQRIQILKTFPKDVQKGYLLFKQGKLIGDFPGDGNGWYTLEPQSSIKFSLNNNDLPPLVGAIPSLIDLQLAQDLDRRKTMQQLLKIIIQKLPLDKNGELIFDVDEAQDIHINAVAMLKKAVGIDVLTTFADVDTIDMSDKNTTTTKDDLEKVERTVFNNLGMSQNLFNTEGNMALEKSIANDEASIRDLIYQFEILLNRVVKKFNKKNQYVFKANILETTIYNYKDLSKLYKEHTQIGFSKILPQVALGHSQSSIIATAQFENNVLKLADIMIPPASSFTTSSTNNKNNEKQQQENKTPGRPEKPDDQKSDKTIKNKEAMG